MYIKKIIIILLLLAVFKSFIFAFENIDTISNYIESVDTMSNNIEKLDTIPNANSIESENSNIVNVEGLIVEKGSGLYPKNDSVVVIIDTVIVMPDQEGNFSCKIEKKNSFMILVQSRNFAEFSQIVKTDTNKVEYFVTCILSEKKKTDNKKKNKLKHELVTGPPFVITGVVTDSRFSLEIKNDSMELFFDDKPVAVSKRGKYRIETKYSGEHVLHLKIPGYHEIFDRIVLQKYDRNIYHLISTTDLKHKNNRREMTVSAKSVPLHQKAEPSKIIISRRKLLDATSDASDPIRILQTLPGISSTSDASARPIVRGGDPLEARCFLDGIPMIQPYHYGGFKSIFNKAAIKNLTVYKTGFPVKYHNAQSAIILADTRSPIDDTVSVMADLNALQYNLYASFPIRDKVGLFAYSQGSFYDFMIRNIGMNIAKGSAKDKSEKDRIKKFKDVMHFPDYSDIAGGIEIKPNEKIKIKIANTYNTDRMQFASPDSIKKYTYSFENKYYSKDDFGNIELYNGLTGDFDFDKELMDTSFKHTVTVAKGWFAWWEFLGEEQYVPGNIFADGYDYYDSSSNKFFIAYDTCVTGKTHYRIDTLINYKSKYNVLYTTLTYLPNKDNIVNVKLAWQKRWWDIKFPENDAYEGMFSSSKFDVDLNQANLYFDWTYTGKENHLFNAGIQLDYMHAKYNVKTNRFLHELITKGSTNFYDTWGGITKDNGLSVTDTAESIETSIIELYAEKFKIAYSGKTNYLNGALYFDDNWDVNDRFRVNYGVRLEVSSADTSVMLSPRIASMLKINEKNEFVANIGLYSQNNYEPAVIALSKKLRPEKVLHSGIGWETELRPGLIQSINGYWKYYYHLVSESYTPSLNGKPISASQKKDLIDDANSMGLIYKSEEDMLTAFYLLNDELVYDIGYTNNGHGYATGFEYMLNYDLIKHWYGWFSFTLSKSKRQRVPGSNWYNYAFDRPVLVSLVNFFRLPRKYEIGVKYRYMSGIPYTYAKFGKKVKGVKIGKFNEERFTYYHRMDMKISRGFRIREVKGHLYLELWNMFNSGNSFLRDRKTKEIHNFDFNVGSIIPFIGIDCRF